MSAYIHKTGFMFHGMDVHRACTFPSKKGNDKRKYAVLSIELQGPRGYCIEVTSSPAGNTATVYIREKKTGKYLCDYSHH